MARTTLPHSLPSLLRAGVLLSLAATALAADTEFSHAAGTDSTGWAQAVSDAAGRVLIESPEFPRGLWVDLVDEEEQALPGIQVEYQNLPDSLVVIWSFDPSGQRKETLLWTHLEGGPLRLALQAESVDLPPGLASIDWRVEPGAEELPVLADGPDLMGWEAVAAFLQEPWQGRTGRLAVRIDSSTALAVDLSHPDPVERLGEYLLDRTTRSLGEARASALEILLIPYAFHEDLALFGDSILLTTSLVLVQGSELEEWILHDLGMSRGPVPWSEASAVTSLSLGWRGIVDVSPLAVLTNLEWLSLGGNLIVDVSPLAALTNLQYLV